MKKSQEVESEITLNRVTLAIEGTSALLVNRDWQTEKDRPNDGPDKKIAGNKAGKRLTAEEQFRNALHTPETAGYEAKKGVYLLPTSAIHRALWTLGKRATKKWPQTELKSIISVSGDFEDDRYSQIIGQEPTCFTAIATTKGMSRAPYMAHRAKFEKGWRIVITLQTVEQSISIEDAVSLLQLAGQVNGIGSFRPENGGRFGRFVIPSSEIVIRPVAMPMLDFKRAKA